MKKSYLFISLFVAIGAFATIFYSCKKNTDPINNPTLSQTTGTNDDQVKAKIQKFISDVKRTDKSTLSAMSIDEVIWNVEAAMNYSYCRADLKYENPSESLKEVSISLNQQGTTDFENVAALYNTAVTAINNHINTISGAKHFILVDIEKIAETGSNLTLKIKSVVGIEGSAKSIEGYYPWLSTDNRFWNGSGSCTGTTYSDACASIRSWVNSYFSFIQGTYFTDLETKIASAANFRRPGDATVDNILDYRMFAQDSNLPNFDLCLTYTPNNELNVYSQGTLDVANNLAPNGVRPSMSKYPISVTGIWGIHYTQYPYNNAYYHQAYISYGVPHSGGGGQ